MAVHINDAAVNIAQINKAFAEQFLKYLASFDAALDKEAILG